MLKKYIFKHKFFIKVLYEDDIKLEFIKSYVFTNVLILKKIWIVKFLTKVNIYVENKKNIDEDGKNVWYLKLFCWKFI